MRTILSMLIISVALACIFTPNNLLLKWGATYANEIMLGYLGLGLLFLIAKEQRLMFISFACCAMLSLYLKEVNYPAFPVHHEEEEISPLRVAHFNLANTEGGYEETIQRILSSNADIVSLQEFTPDWKELLDESLSQVYPNAHKIIRMDPFGMAVYSKYEFLFIDTFLYDDLPNIIVRVKPMEFSESIYVISSYTTPPLYTTALKKMRNHLDKLSAYIKALQGPVIAVGAYHAPPWWKEIVEFKSETKLLDSRKQAIHQYSSFLSNPVDYILYSEHLNCLTYEHISTEASSSIGILGAYQYNGLIYHASSEN